MTPSMTGYSFGDVVLVPFPFTDQSNRKKRPAAVISSDAYNQAKPDLIIIAVTSQVKPTSSFGEVTVRDWQGAGLLKPSVIKPVIATIEKSFVLQKLGRLKQEDQAALRQALTVIVG